MDLHGIASGVIGAVNPNVSATLRISNGYTTQADGKQVPVYLPDKIVKAQVQALTTKDLRQLDALNVQESQRTIYLRGEVDAIQRVKQKGGDLIVLKDGTIWLTTALLEAWPDWCRVSVTLQNGS